MSITCISSPRVAGWQLVKHRSAPIRMPQERPIACVCNDGVRHIVAGCFSDSLQELIGFGWDINDSQSVQAPAVSGIFHFKCLAPGKAKNH